MPNAVISMGRGIGQSSHISQRSILARVVRNTILLRLPPREFEEIRSHVEFCELRQAARLQRDSEPIRFGYFVNSGIASMLMETPDGRSVEVGIAGREEMIGLQVVAGLTDLSYAIIVQVPGSAFRIPARTICKLLPSLPELNRLLIRQLAIRSIQLARNAGCNRLHTVKQRLARWLLVTQDRVESPFIETTHDFLATMVGTDRPSVSVAFRDLESRGVIKRGRGTIAIVNRQLLEKESCECYAVYERFNAEQLLAGPDNFSRVA
jgi:CRP-like cAMP-binding protein